MKTILLPTDFSNNALIAADFAANKLCIAKTKLVITHVYDIPRGGTSGLFYLLEELQKQAEKDISELKSTLEKRYQHLDVEIETQLSQGSFAERITNIANSLNVDCIVMGTKGTSALKEVFIGSSTISLMKRLEKPLYIVPESEDLEIKEVILCTDGENFKKATVQEAISFTQAHQLSIQLLHIRMKESDLIQDWSELKKPFEGLDVDMHEAFGESLEEGLKNGTIDYQPLLVMIKRQHGFWDRFFTQSKSQKMVMHSNRPILILPE